MNKQELHDRIMTLELNLSNKNSEIVRLQNYINYLNEEAAEQGNAYKEAESKLQEKLVAEKEKYAALLEKYILLLNRLTKILEKNNES